MLIKGLASVSSFPYIIETGLQLIQGALFMSGQYLGKYADAIDSPVSARCKKFVRQFESKNDYASLGLEADGSIAYGAYQFGMRQTSEGLIPAKEVIDEYSKRSGDGQFASVDWTRSTQEQRKALQEISNSLQMIAAQEAVADYVYFRHARNHIGLLATPAELMFAYNVWINFGSVYAPAWYDKGVDAVRNYTVNKYSGLQSEYADFRYGEIKKIMENDPYMASPITLQWKEYWTITL